MDSILSIELWMLSFESSECSVEVFGTVDVSILILYDVQRQNYLQAHFFRTYICCNPRYFCCAYLICNQTQV